MKTVAGYTGYTVYIAPTQVSLFDVAGLEGLAASFETHVAVFRKAKLEGAYDAATGLNIVQSEEILDVLIKQLHWPSLVVLVQKQMAAAVWEIDSEVKEVYL